MKKVSKAEKNLLDSYEKGEWSPVRGSRKVAARYARYARNTFRKDRRVNIRLSSRDVDEIRRIAAEEGLAYQSLIASILHKYVTGRLLEKRIGAGFSIREND